MSGKSLAISQLQILSLPAGRYWTGVTEQPLKELLALALSGLCRYPLKPAQAWVLVQVGSPGFLPPPDPGLLVSHFPWYSMTDSISEHLVLLLSEGIYLLLGRPSATLSFQQQNKQSLQ